MPAGMLDVYVVPRQISMISTTIILHKIVKELFSR